MSANHSVGAVLVCGAGIAGVQAALDLADSGFKVYLLERSPAIGGGMARLDKTFPTGDCSMCLLSPKLVECARNRNIEIITRAEVEGVTGAPGDFEVEITRFPSYVDPVKCNACGDCAEACPVNVPSEFDGGIGQRKAIFRPYPQAIPNVFGISKAEGISPCRAACPAGVNPHGYVALIGQGRFKEAYDLIRERCPLPSVCGHICHHPCESKCNRAEVDAPVAVRDLKRFAADYVHAHWREFGDEQSREHSEPAPSEQSRSERIAVIGGGPAGLTAADDLARLGYGVTIFEVMPFLGGALRLGVPEYRLPRDMLDHEIDRIVRGRIEVRLECRIGRDLSFQDLREQGYAAIFLATGAQRSRQLGIEGEDADGVIDALTFLRRANLGEPVVLGRRVVVIGGGNVAIDAARCARRLGAEEVELVCLETRDAMPAHAWEIEEALEEGVRIRAGWGPKRIRVEGGRVTDLECVPCTSVFDETGRFSPQFDDAAQCSVPTDAIIVAIGQTADLTGLPFDGSARVDCDDSLATELPGVFAGGDAVLGPASLVEAMAHGHRAAEAIHRYLQGQAGPPQPWGGLRADGTANPPPAPRTAPNPDPYAPPRPRLPMPHSDPLARARDFREIDLGYSEEQAVAEAQRCLNCGICSECRMCEKACQPGALRHEMGIERQQLRVGAIIVAPGFQEFQASLRGEYGHGRYPNVLSSVQFERLLSAAGPTGGQVIRPSDGEPVKRVAFIQCVGSRDHARGNPYCSSACCMAAVKEAVVAMEHNDGLEATIFCSDVRAFGKEFDRYVERARDAGQGRAPVRYVRAIPSRVVQVAGSKNPRVRYFDEQSEERQEEFDLIVLSVGMRPSADVGELAERLGLERNQFGFCATERESPVITSRPGVFVAGAFQEPKDIPDAVAQASAAAAAAMELLADARGTLVHRREYPWERDVTDEEPRVGVFICHCGHNIASVVDVEAVAREAASLPNVCHAETNLYTCSDATQQRIRDLIAEHQLNRLVVASCSPRTHEPLFQETLRETGLNPYLFAMTNIREQCSWVHRADRDGATAKAHDLVAMAVGRARWLRALPTTRLPVTRSALVIGGGLAGMTAAVSLADQGFAIHLVEKETELGGQLRHITRSLEGTDVVEFRSRLIAQVMSHLDISVYLGAQVVATSGHVGNFRSQIEVRDEAVSVNHGATIIATGATERATDEYLRGEDPRVITQRELEIQLSSPVFPDTVGHAPTVVMIQCVGSRTDEYPYCSRVCCSEAVKNALALKAARPAARVIILMKDMRTYGFREVYLQRAREAGVLFVRYPESQAPRVTGGSELTVSVTDTGTRRELALHPDLLVLSTGIAPAPDNPALSRLLRTPLTADGFFLEAHPKLRPVDLASEGVFVCGLAHSPRFMDESISQAKAVAARAATILARPYLEIPGHVARVDEDKCVACMTCARTCPYGAPAMNDRQKMEISVANCLGCGSCASSCPARAIQLQHMEDRQLMGMLEELLSAGKEVS